MVRRRVAVPMVLLVLACAVGGALPAGAAAEQASEPASLAADGLDAGGSHSCAVLGAGSVRCWGLGASGQLGYGGTDTIGDDETPASTAPVSVGAGRTVKAIAAGDFHTCAILDDGTVRCWGFGADGRLGYGNTNDVPDPSSVGPVNLSGHAATAITAGPAHTCVILDDASVRCWGFGGGGPGFPEDGRLGYGNTDNVGGTPATTPDKVGAVKLGAGSRAVAISAGGAHTCVILDDGTVRCWGIGAYGQLGYGNTDDVGDKPTNTPDTVGPVNLGGHKATAISAGGLGVGVDAGTAGAAHTCAILDDGSVRCWGYGADGRLGYGNTRNVGATPATTPDTAGPVKLGPRRTAVAISAGQDHTCAILDDRSVRCWGLGTHGRLGYPTLDSFGNQPNVGAAPTTTPDTVGPVDLGSHRGAVAISAGGQDTCARLDDARVRCWGYGAYGQLGYCNTDSVGDDEPPGSVGPVNLQPGDGGTGCAHPVDPLHLEALRAQAMHSCLARAARRPKPRRSRARRDCVKRYGRTPGPIKALHAHALSSTTIVLTFAAPGSDGQNPPAARTYLIKQSQRPIRGARDFLAAPTLCNGYCQFKVSAVGTKIKLTITHLPPHSTDYYAVKARDNVSNRLGPRSPAVEVRTR